MPCSDGCPKEYRQAARFEEKHAREAMELMCDIFIKHKIDNEKIVKWTADHEKWDVYKEDLTSSMVQRFFNERGIE